jgi:hypothetical protein
VRLQVLALVKLYLVALHWSKVKPLPHKLLVKVWQLSLLHKWLVLRLVKAALKLLNVLSMYKTHWLLQELV